jgi:hypothetical protein
MAYCMECKRGVQESDLRLLPTTKKNVTRHCCEECLVKIIRMRKQAKLLAKQMAVTTIKQKNINLIKG